LRSYEISLSLSFTYLTFYSFLSFLPSPTIITGKGSAEQRAFIPASLDLKSRNESIADKF
jgi:hypothetical protein